MKTSSRESGFTLVELVITVAIIGVLAVVGVPTYRRFIERAIQAEAKVSLGSIARAQQAYFAEYERYGQLCGGADDTKDWNSDTRHGRHSDGTHECTCDSSIGRLAMQIDDCQNSYYGYGSSQDTAGPQSFFAIAGSGCGAEEDLWEITSANRALRHVRTGATQCEPMESGH